MVALSQLCKPNHQGNQINWDTKDNKTEKLKEPLPTEKESLKCTINICIIYYTCYNIPKFTTATEFLAHAVTVHVYDINIKLHHLPTKLWLTCSGTSSVDSTVKSGESDGRSGTDTPASSVGPETVNIDPRLLKPHKPKVTELRCSKRLRLQ
ncbi:hypothetical protein BDW68DRAFT_189182 [Aspergillus falconensis]